MAIYKAYFDRDKNSIDSGFTIHKDGVPVVFKGLKIERLQARCGQRGYTASSWTRSKSPIPYSKEVKGGKLYLWTTPIGLGTKPGKTGIGEAYPISSHPSNWDLIESAIGHLIRELIRLHGENALPGSAGCPVLVKEREYQLVFEFLRWLHSQGIEKIEIDVL